jgi:hypothetical protein
MTAKVKRIERTGGFTAIDEHGVRHTFHVFASLVEGGPLAGTEGGIRGIQSIWTADGEGVERIARGVYRTAWSETLRSDDPDAP